MSLINPQISIVTITFNSEKTLEQTILSVINQGYDNLEYIIIDGGSNDGTLEIVNKYRDKIAVFVSEKDEGISDAFNKGIRAATGVIIGIINSDDILSDGALKTIASEYEPEIDVYRGIMEIWDDINDKKYVNIPAMNFPLNKNIRAVCHPSTFITKAAYEKWGVYRTNMKYRMDADILYRFYIKGAKFKYVNKALAVFRLGGATSDDWRKKIPELRQMIINNGGSSILADFLVAKESLYCILKQAAFAIIGTNIARSLRYLHI